MPNQLRPVFLNPLLTLVKEYETVNAGGGSAKKVREALFAERCRLLRERFKELGLSGDTKAAVHSGRVLVWVGMDPDSQAPSHTPEDLFKTERGNTAIVSAWRDGYVVDMKFPESFDYLQRRTSGQITNNERADISRIDKVELFSHKLANRDSITRVWEMAVPDQTGYRAFVVRMPPFATISSRKAVKAYLIQRLREGRISLAAASSSNNLNLSLPLDGSDNNIPQERTVAIADTLSGWVSREQFPQLEKIIDENSGSRNSAITIGAKTIDDLIALVSSGSISKWEPVVPLRPMPAGSGPEPDSKLPPLDDYPIVGVIDGGYHGQRYQSAVAWRVAPFIADHLADRAHGNKVTSLTVDAHLWSNHLKLPDIHCRVGVVQAVPRRGAGAYWSLPGLFSYLENVLSMNPDTHVWNLSANLPYPCNEYSVSEIGHKFSELARKHSKLLVVSAGNQDGGSDPRIAPPADCEAALVVGGRVHGPDGEVSGPCSVSCRGPGPEGMLKPEASWFSSHRVLGGGLETGTSYAAPLISRLAAHTWNNLSSATPDLVKALIIQASDLPAYRNDLGFGSPIVFERPWLCPSNVVTIAWSQEILQGAWYRWTNISIPPSLIKGGRFVGRAKLVAILNPVVNLDGHSYFCTRLHAALHYVNNAGNEVALIGSMPDETAEVTAREEDAKWQPVRCYYGEFSDAHKKCRGSAQISPTLGRAQLIVKARLYWRNKFLFSEEHIRSTPCNVTFVLRLESSDSDADTYNEFRQLMQSDVESAVIETDIETDAEGF